MSDEQPLSPLWSGQLRPQLLRTRQNSPGIFWNWMHSQLPLHLPFTITVSGTNLLWEPRGVGRAGSGAGSLDSWPNHTPQSPNLTPFLYLLGPTPNICPAPVVILGGWLENVSHPWVLVQGRWQCQLSFPSSYFARSLSSDTDHLWGQSDRWGESTTSKSGLKVSTCFVIRPRGVGLNQDGFGAS